jgi:hypothetical protein
MAYQISSKSAQGSRVESIGQPDGQTDMISPICINFMHTVQGTHIQNIYNWRFQEDESV